MPRKLTADEIRELQERRKAARDKAAREGTYQPMYDPYALTNSEYYNEVMSEQQQQRQEAERIALERLQQEKLIEQQQEEQRRAEINEVGQMFVTEAKKKRAGSASNAYEQVAAAAEKIKAGKDKPSTEAAPQNLPTAAQAKPGSKNEWQAPAD